MSFKILMPKLSDTMTEGIILKWQHNEGDKINQGDILVEIQSDKADMELEAYESGYLRKIIIPNGGKAAIGSIIGIIGDLNEDISNISPDVSMEAGKKEILSIKPAYTDEKTAIDQQKPSERINASPLARRLAKEKNIPLENIRGSGPNGRIIEKDIEEALLSNKPSAGQHKDVELSLIRKTISRIMTESKTKAPHFYVSMEIIMDSAIELRNQLNQITPTKISFNDILIKACATTLMKHPLVNGEFLGDRIRENNFVNIGIAVSLDDGLVTPVIRNCHEKSIGQISLELNDLVERARQRKLKSEEFSGATFTISNLGMFGVENFSAIINPPESAILAVSAIIERPVVINKEIVVRNMMNITLSADHRIIDGAAAARFLVDLKHILENTSLIAL